MAKSVNPRELLRMLIAAYGRPRPFRRTDAVDEIVRTILSQNTSDKNSLPAFAELKERFGNWGKVAEAPEGRIAGAIRRAGLANIKAGRIRMLLRNIRGEEGDIRGNKGGGARVNKGGGARGNKGGGIRGDIRRKVSLRWLGKLDTEEAFDYLTSLNGIGPKTASCVLLFSFGKPVMPVDTHIFRVAQRLGLIGPGANIEEAHRILTGICGKNTRLIYDLHLSIIEHGRRTCRARNPRCGSCVLYGACKFRDKEKYA